MMNILAKILSHGFAVGIVALLAIGFIYRGELFPELQLPDFLIPEAETVAESETEAERLETRAGADEPAALVEAGSATEQLGAVGEAAPATAPELAGEGTAVPEPGLDVDRTMADEPEPLPQARDSAEAVVPGESISPAPVVEVPAREAEEAMGEIIRPLDKGRFAATAPAEAVPEPEPEPRVVATTPPVPMAVIGEAPEVAGAVEDAARAVAPAAPVARALEPGKVAPRTVTIPAPEVARAVEDAAQAVAPVAPEARDLEPGKMAPRTVITPAPEVAGAVEGAAQAVAPAVPVARDLEPQKVAPRTVTTPAPEAAGVVEGAARAVAPAAPVARAVVPEEATAESPPVPAAESDREPVPGLMDRPSGVPAVPETPTTPALPAATTPPVTAQPVSEAAGTVAADIPAASATVVAKASSYQLLASAREAFWLHDYEKAESIYRQLTVMEPDNPDWFGELGNMYFSQGNWDEAAFAYFEAGVRLVKTERLDPARELVNVIRGLDGSQAQELEKMIHNAGTSAN
jgi:hypothetical protein